MREDDSMLLRNARRVRRSHRALSERSARAQMPRDARVPQPHVRSTSIEHSAARIDAFFVSVQFMLEFSGRDSLPAGEDSVNVSEHLLKRLAAWGVRHVYGYPGDGIN